MSLIILLALVSTLAGGKWAIYALVFTYITGSRRKHKEKALLLLLENVKLGQCISETAVGRNSGVIMSIVVANHKYIIIRVTENLKNNLWLLFINYVLSSVHKIKNGLFQYSNNFFLYK